MKTTYDNWKLNIDDEKILWLSVDRKGEKVNTLNRDTIAEFDQIIDEIKSESELVGVVILSAKNTGFIAGADIEQFTKLKTQDEAYDLIRQAQLVFDKLETIKIPTVALIEGFCLGGGCELSLACRYRVAVDTRRTKIGLPEVMLGIRPGWGGSVRLPKLIGAIKAMGIILPGRAVNARKAYKLGMVDAAVPERQAKRAARSFVLNKPAKHRASKLENLTNARFIRPLLGRKMVKQLQSKIRKEHYPAPYDIVKTWVRDGVHGKKAMQGEAKSIAKLMITETARNLVRVFFLQTRMKGLAKVSKFKAQHVHVIGAGTMGGDIAAWCAFRGLTVTLQDREPKFIAPAIKRAHKLFKKKLRKPYLAQLAMDRLMPDPQGLGVEKADVIIEAIFENKEAKHELYKSIEPRMKKGAILATNTSSLPLDELNTVLKNPESLVGIHFFNPVPKMQLVEVVSGKKTSKQVADDATSFIGQIGRLPLPVKSEPGFLINRILMPYMSECGKLIEEGVPLTKIDRAALKFGMPMGPVELLDTVGLDVCLSVAEVLSQHYGGDVPKPFRDMVAKGDLGRKTGKGFYSYDKKGKVIKPATEDGSKVPSDMTDRLILRMLNEAVACLRENIVADADLLDVGMIFGTGFAPFRGGPINYAKTRGIDDVVKSLEALAQKHGDRFKPDQGWQALQETKAKPAEKPKAAAKPKVAPTKTTKTGKVKPAASVMPPQEQG